MHDMEAGIKQTKTLFVGVGAFVGLLAFLSSLQASNGFSEGGSLFDGVTWSVITAALLAVFFLVRRQWLSWMPFYGRELSDEDAAPVLMQSLHMYRDFVLMCVAMAVVQGTSVTRDIVNQNWALLFLSVGLLGYIIWRGFRFQGQYNELRAELMYPSTEPYDHDS